MMNVAIVANLQMMTACAIYGFSLLWFYLFASIFFFFPSILLVAEMSTSHPVTGGAYVWVEKAMGKKMGFFAVCIQWICNVIWYPTIFSFVIVLLSNVIYPEGAQEKLFTVGGAILLLWIVTYCNCLGIRVSSFISGLCAVFGIIIPVIILIGFGIYWVIEGMPLAENTITFSVTDTSKWAFFTQIIISLIGIEMVAVHAGDIRNPTQSIPKGLTYSAFWILFVVISAPLAISIVIPPAQIEIISGSIDAIKLFFQKFGFSSIYFLIVVFLMFIGNIGSVTAWMISATRGMHVASLDIGLPKIFQYTNRYKAPVGILLLEACIFTLMCSLFFFSTINNSYWLLLELASQIALTYYILIFISAVLLKRKLDKQNSSYFKIWGGVKGTSIFAFFAIFSALLAIIFGFFPPSTQTLQEQSLYTFILVLGIAIGLLTPVLLLQFAKKKDS